MKKLFILALAMCLSFYGCGENESGNVDDMIVETQKVVDDGVRMIKGLDKKGRVLKETCYNDDGEVDVVIEYDKNGNKTKSYQYEDGIACVIVEYGKNGNAVAETWYDYDDGFLDEWKEIEYYENGEVSKSIWYKSDGSVDELDEYYENGVLKKEYNFVDSEGKITEYEYDRDGNCIRSIIIDESDNSHYREEMTYDSDGKLIKTTCYYNDEFDGWYEYEYDKNGKRISSTFYDKDGNIRTGLGSLYGNNE